MRRLRKKELEETLNRDYIHPRKVNLAQYVIVMVIGHYVACIGGNGTIHELIVVGVGLYQPELIIWSDELNERCILYSTHHNLCKLGSKQSLKYLCILVKNLRSYTQSILPNKKRLPNRKVLAAGSDTLYEAIRVKNDAHLGSIGNRIKGLLFAQPSMEIRLTDFIETSLAKSAIIPQLFQLFIHLSRIIVIEDFTHFFHCLISLYELKEPKQVYLSLGQYSRFHTLSVLI